MGAALVTEPAKTAIGFRVEVPFGPRWQNVELLRMSILHCVATIFQSGHFCDHVALVTAELLENAMHYGDWRGRDPRTFRLAIEGLPVGVMVEVTNPVDPEDHNVLRLQRLVERIRRSPSVRDAYIDRLHEVAVGPLARGSGLGLFRIVYETDCRLDVSVVDRAVRVVAVLGLSDAGGVGRGER